MEYIVMNVMLFMLFFLHCYWFGVIVKIGVMLVRTGSTKDLQANISSMDLVYENARSRKQD